MHHLMVIAILRSWIATIGESKQGAEICVVPPFPGLLNVGITELIVGAIPQAPFLILSLSISSLCATHSPLLLFLQ